MKPALAAFLSGARIPGDRQCLQATVGKFDEILLQRINAKRVFDLIILQLAIRPIGIDKKFSAALKKCTGDACIGKLGAVEITEHALLARCGHRVVMLRFFPLSSLVAVARGTSIAANVLSSHLRTSFSLSFCSLSPWERPRVRVPAQEKEQSSPDPYHHQRNSTPKQTVSSSGWRVYRLCVSTWRLFLRHFFSICPILSDKYP